MNKIKVAIVGCGNVGEYALKAVKNAPDMEIGGIVEQSHCIIEKKEKHPQLLIVDDIKRLQKIDVAVLAIPSLSIEKVAPRILKQGINTIDSFDIHGEKLFKLKKKLSKVSKEYNSVSITAVGWDPGIDSVIRAIFLAMAPQGLTNTNFGPGMSMGHTVAVKNISGVKDALSLTIPNGFNNHKRKVYVELEDKVNLEDVTQRINNHQYFIHDKTEVIEIKDVDNIIDYGHKVLINRQGVASGTHNQEMKYQASITNPAVTAQIMVTAARASVKQKANNHLLVEIPIIDFISEENKNEIIKEIM